MTEINFHPNDKILSTLELAKNVGLFVFVISVFEGMFYAMYLEGQILMPLLCGVPLGLILILVRDDVNRRSYCIGQTSTICPL